MFRSVPMEDDGTEGAFVGKHGITIRPNHISSRVAPPRLPG